MNYQLKEAIRLSRKLSRPVYMYTDGTVSWQLDPGKKRVGVIGEKP